MALRLSLLIFALILPACGQEEEEVFNAAAVEQKWRISGRTWAEAELQSLDNGEKLYRVNCSACHAQDGKGDNQMGAPALDRSPLVVGKQTDLLVRLLKGKQGTSMPAFAGSLSDKEVADVSTYIRNAWENRSGDVVLKADVASVR